MFCRNCGKEMADGWAVCPHCGQAVGGQSPAAPANAGKTVKNGKKPKEEGAGLNSKVVLSKGILMEKVINKAKKIETVKVSCQELVKMANMFFIQPATSEAELEEIRKRCSKKFLSSMVVANYLQSKDGRYAWVIDFGGHGIGAAINKRVEIRDVEANKYYELQKRSEMKIFIKDVKDLINARKTSLNIAIIPDDDDEEDDDDFAEDMMENATGNAAAASASAAAGVPTEPVGAEPQTAGASGGKASYAELVELKNLLDMGIITEDEFAAKKKELLGL